MKILSLNAVERMQTGFTHKVNITYKDLTANALTQTLNVFPKAPGTIPAFMAVTRFGFKLLTEFRGGSIASLKMDVGDAGSSTKYVAQANTDLYNTLATNPFPGAVTSMNQCYTPANVATQTSINCILTSTIGNLNTATQGEVELYFNIVDLNDLNRPKGNY